MITLSMSKGHPSPSQRLSLRGRSPSGAEPEPAATLPLPHQETVSQCHSEALAEACPEQSEGTHEILHGVYPEAKRKTLRFAQGDTWRRVQNDKHAISLIVTQPPRGRGLR